MSSLIGWSWTGSSHTTYEDMQFENWQYSDIPGMQNERYLRCLWCLHQMKKIQQSVFVGSNQLDTDKRSFAESFRKITFFFSTLLMPPTCALTTGSVVSAKCVFLTIFHLVYRSCKGVYGRVQKLILYQCVGQWSSLIWWSWTGGRQTTYEDMQFENRQNHDFSCMQD